MLHICNIFDIIGSVKSINGFLFVVFILISKLGKIKYKHLDLYTNIMTLI